MGLMEFTRLEKAVPGLRTYVAPSEVWVFKDGKLVRVEPPKVYERKRGGRESVSD